jgi:phenylalanyl-tRNA synthetase beta chain
VVEDVLVGAGLSEAYTWSLAPSDPSPDSIRLPDPMTSDQAILRTTLLPGLVSAARTALDTGASGIGLFEIARVYLPSGEQLPNERWRLGGVVQGGYAAAKGILEALYGALHLELRVRRGSHPLFHPGKTAETEAGVLGELHPALLEGEWGALELDLEMLFEPVPDRVFYEDVITYPAVRQDLAFVVDEDVLAGELIEVARAAAGPELREVRVFDVYRGGQIAEGKKSIALHVAFQSPERTLSDDDARGLRERIVSALAERFSAELRA